MSEDNIRFWVNITDSDGYDIWFNKLKLSHLKDIIDAYEHGREKCWTAATEWHFPKIKSIRIYAYNGVLGYSRYNLMLNPSTSPYQSRSEPDLSMFIEFKEMTEEFIHGPFGYKAVTTESEDKLLPMPEQKSGKTRKVFIVHGHDEALKQAVARLVEKLDYEAIILHEQPNCGRTIIEKIEANSDVEYGIVLYTPCDEGRAVGDEPLRKRARQNVVFEHGYLVGKLGRVNVSAIVKGDIELPGDLSGLVYTDSKKDWRLELAKNMKAAGLDVDMNKL